MQSLLETALQLLQKAAVTLLKMADSNIVVHVAGTIAVMHTFIARSVLHSCCSCYMNKHQKKKTAAATAAAVGAAAAAKTQKQTVLVHTVSKFD
jgi:hypothetical protein